MYQLFVLALARAQYILLFSNSLLPVASAALSVKFRGQSNEEDAEKNPDLRQATISGFDGMPSFEKVPVITGGPRRNPVVETFFADTLDPTSNSTAVSEFLVQEVKEKANGIFDFLLFSRRFLHKHPELMYREEITSAYVQKVLQDLDIKFTGGWGVNSNPDIIDGPGGYGVVADIGTGEPPCVLLRADMDGLPIVERTEGVDGFKSKHDGRMHACGHDGHTTMLLGAAKVLKSMEDSINGTVRLMFQPAEEGGAGGKRMREEGVLSLHPPVMYAFGQHVWPTLPSGVIASRAGPLLAAAEMFEVLVAGVGGHAAMPHLTVDPIVAASNMVANLQTIVSRITSPLESGVVSITTFQAGGSFNVIPNSVLLRGTIRALRSDTLMTLRDRVHKIVETTAEVHGCNVTITYSPDYYPPTVNDPELFESFSKDVGAMVAEGLKLTDIEPTMGAEDFSFLGEEIPSTFFLLGQGSGVSPDTSFGLHHPHFALDESVLPRGVELHVNVALRALQKLAYD